MNNLLSSFFVNIIKDKPVFYSMLGTIWRVAFTPFSLLLIALKMTPEMQGFYYLFFSIAGMQQIIEAGFSHTLVQSVSHEMGNVKFEKHYLVGDGSSLYNIGQAMRLGFLWYFLIGLFCLIVIYPIGYFFIAKDHADNLDLWFVPWTAFIISFTLNLLLYPVNFFFEGILHLEKIYKNRFIIQLSSSIVFVVALLLGCGLYSILAFSLCSFVTNFMTLFLPNRKQFLEYIFCFPTMTYFRTIFKWQLKVGLVWCSGYLYWQLPTIIIFSYLGPVCSGQYSMTMNVVNAVMNIGQVFIKTKAALIGKLRAMNLFLEAYTLYKKYSKWSYITIFLGSICFLSMKLVIPDFVIWERMLSFSQILILFIFCSINVITQNQAMFARCCKDEPFFKMSIFVNFIFPGLLYVLLYFLSSTWSIVLTIGIIYLVQLFWGNSLFCKLYRMQTNG